MRRHCHDFLEALDRSGYDKWWKIPVLIDWNLGNFSVENIGDRFRLFSRWDYDWFRIDSRMLDFYFFSRVSSRTGDRTMFSVRPSHAARAAVPTIPAVPTTALFPLTRRGRPLPRRGLPVLHPQLRDS